MPSGKDLIRIFSGGFVLVSGLMMLGLFGWEPPVAGPEARPFQSATHDAGYFLPIITTVFLVAGASFVFNLFGAASTLAQQLIEVNGRVVRKVGSRRETLSELAIQVVLGTRLPVFQQMELGGPVNL